MTVAIVMLLFPGPTVKVNQAVVRGVTGREFGVKIVLMVPREAARLGLLLTKLVQQQLGYNLSFGRSDCCPLHLA